MESIEIKIDRADLQSPVAMIRLKGVIDTSTAPLLEQQINDVISDATYRIVVDLTKVDYISSAGWGVFISKIRHLRENGGDMLLAGMVPEVQEVFDLLEFPQVFTSFSSPEDAAQRFIQDLSCSKPQ
jgi:anti-sigma B factor antagonist